MKELEDYKWFPSELRNFQTEFIGYLVTRFKVYDVFITYLKNCKPPMLSMMDMCSGSGEPAICIFEKSGCFRQLTLSDKYPNPLGGSDTKTLYEIQKKDVLSIDFTHGTCYTMFNAFHHFKDREKQIIVQKICDSGSSGFIVEVLEPRLFCLLKVIFATTFGNLLLTPLIKPFSWRRIFFTYIIPVNLLTITYDGVVSVLKSRTVLKYQHLLSDCGKAIKIFRLNHRFHTLIVIQIDSQI